MAQPRQNTQKNSADSILRENIPNSVSIKQPSLVVSVFKWVGGYLRDSWSNRHWELKLQQIEKDLKEREQDLKEQQANFDRNSIRLVEGKAALADQRQALEAMRLALKEERDRLQCIKDTFRAEREVLCEQTIEAAKDAAKSECEVIRDCATQALQTINTEIGQKQAELLALEERLRALREVFAGVAETVDMSLRECAQGSKSTPGKSIYLVSTNNPEEVAVPLANRESKQVETADWAPSLFATQKPEISSSELITSATSLRVGA